MKTTKIFWDCEFTGLRKNTTLISIGLVSECGKTFYAESLDYDKSQIDEWLQKNVIDNLRFTDRITASCGAWENWLSDKNKYRNALDMSLAESDGRADMSNFECIGKMPMINNRLTRWLSKFEDIEMWGDCMAYDWVLFCDIFGHAFNIPKNINYIPFDLSTVFKEKGIDPDINREEYAGNMIEVNDAHNWGVKKHNALWDAYVIRECYNKTLKTKHITY